MAQVSFLATGNEIVHGDTVDTNTLFFSQSLHQVGCHLGPQIRTSDTQEEIVDAILYLLDRSNALIITGGLGPTTDDRTRFALSQALNQPLIQDTVALTHIEERAQRLEYALNNANLQQALYLEGHTLLPNPLGSACGSYIHIQEGEIEKHIWLLPGPPKENRPMFEEMVIPRLRSLGYFNTEFKQRWLTLGLAESEISEAIAQLLEGTGLEAGYRWDYPYLEIKLETTDEALLLAHGPRLAQHLADYTVSTEHKDAVAQIQEFFAKNTLPKGIAIYDPISKGTLRALCEPIDCVWLKQPEEHHPYSVHFSVTGNSHEFNGRLTYTVVAQAPGGYKVEKQLQTPNRGPEVEEFAKAFTAWQLWSFLKTLPPSAHD